MAKKWTFAQIWNGSFDHIEDRPIKARGYLHASELGNSFIEVFYKLKGTPYTNTFTGANRRKMEAGRMYEAIVRFVLKRAGVLKRAQEPINWQIPGLMEVHGRLDFVAGGQVDLVQAQECTALIKILFEELEFPPIYREIADRTLKMVIDTAGKKMDDLAIYVMEIKSVADFVYRLIEKSTRAMNFHHMQAFHYLFGKKLKEGRVVYVNRDDVRLMEKEVLNNKESYKEYEKWVGQMTDYYNAGTEPPKEPLVVWYSDTCGFGKNTMGVEWCKYLTMIYGYKSAEDFREDIMPKVKSWNYVLDRCVKCSNLTADNLEHIANAKKFFPNWDDLVDQAKLRKVQQGGATIEA